MQFLPLCIKEPNQTGLQTGKIIGHITVTSSMGNMGQISTFLKLRVNTIGMLFYVVIWVYVKSDKSSNFLISA